MKRMVNSAGRSFFSRSSSPFDASVPYSPAPAPVLQPVPANLDTTQQNSAAINSYYPPWVQPPPQFDPVDEISYVPLPAIGQSAVVVSYRVSRGRNGIIHAYGNNFIGGSFQEGAGAIYWQYRRNGNPIKFYEKVLASLGSVAQPTTHPSGFRLFDNDLIELVVFNVSLSVGGAQSGGRLMGWQYPKKYEDPRAWV